MIFQSGQLRKLLFPTHAAPSCHVAGRHVKSRRGRSRPMTDRCSRGLSEHRVPVLALCFRPPPPLNKKPKKIAGINLKTFCPCPGPFFSVLRGSVEETSVGRRRGRLKGGQGVGGGGAAVARGTMGALWHQPLDSPKRLKQRH